MLGTLLSIGCLVLAVVALLLGARSYYNAKKAEEERKAAADARRKETAELWRKYQEDATRNATVAALNAQAAIVKSVQTRTKLRPVPSTKPSVSNSRQTRENETYFNTDWLGDIPASAGTSETHSSHSSDSGCSASSDSGYSSSSDSSSSCGND